MDLRPVDTLRYLPCDAVRYHKWVKLYSTVIAARLQQCNNVALQPVPPDLGTPQFYSNLMDGLLCWPAVMASMITCWNALTLNCSVVVTNNTSIITMDMYYQKLPPTFYSSTRNDVTIAVLFMIRWRQWWRFTWMEFTKCSSYHTRGRCCAGWADCISFSRGKRRYYYE